MKEKHVFNTHAKVPFMKQETGKFHYWGEITNFNYQVLNLDIRV